MDDGRKSIPSEVCCLVVTFCVRGVKGDTHTSVASDLMRGLLWQQLRRRQQNRFLPRFVGAEAAVVMAALALCWTQRKGLNRPLLFCFILLRILWSSRSTLLKKKKKTLLASTAEFVGAVPTQTTRFSDATATYSLHRHDCLFSGRRQGEANSEPTLVHDELSCGAQWMPPVRATCSNFLDCHLLQVAPFLFEWISNSLPRLTGFCASVLPARISRTDLSLPRAVRFRPPSYYDAGQLRLTARCHICKIVNIYATATFAC